MKSKTIIKRSLIAVTVALSAWTVIPHVTQTENLFASTQWHAVCDMPHGLTVGWVGPSQYERRFADKDAANHNKAYKGHNATVTQA